MLSEGGESPRSFFSALWTGLKRAILITQLTIIGLLNLFSNLILNGSVSSDVVGPVGIFGVAQDTGRIGMIYLVQLISLISINLAVVNLIPFPALDGGRLFMILIEKIKGSPVSHKIEMVANGMSFAFLLLLMVILTFQDIVRMFA